MEQTLETIGKWAADGEAQQNIFINDPVAGVSYSLDPRARAAYKNPIPQKSPPVEKRSENSPSNPAGAPSETLMVNGQKVTTNTITGQTVTQAEFEAFVAAKKKRDAREEPPARPIKPDPDDPELKKKLEMLQQVKTDGGQRKTESLGTQTIEGVTAEGMRSTLTIPAGEIGNTLPIEIIDENWYSPELQTMVMTKHRDPRSGETTYRLTNISRSEPDRSLFEVPADYTVRENKMPIKMAKPTKEEQ